MLGQWFEGESVSVGARVTLTGTEYDKVLPCLEVFGEPHVMIALDGPIGCSGWLIGRSPQ